MNDLTPASVFPPQGKILVVGVHPDAETASRYSDRLLIWEPSRIGSLSDIPKDVAAIVRAKGLDDRVEERLSRCIRIRGLRLASLETDSASLRLRLEQWLKNVNLPAKKAETATVVIQIDGVDVEIEGFVVLIDTDRIKPYADQPREYIDPTDLKDLASSIEERGQETPIVVTRIKDDPEHDFMIIAGERRWQACTMISKKKMRAIVTAVSDEEELFELSMGENANRKELLPTEMVKSMTRVLNHKRYEHLTHAERLRIVCRLTGWKAQWVEQYLQIPFLPEKVRAMMGPTVPPDQRLKVSLAVFLTTISKHYAPEKRAELQEDIATESVRKGFTIQQARSYARTRTAQLGVTIGLRKPKPADNYRTYFRLSTSIHRDVRILRDMSTEEIRSMLRSRSEEERTALVQLFKSTRQELNALVSSLERLSEKS